MTVVIGQRMMRYCPHCDMNGAYVIVYRRWVWIACGYCKYQTRKFKKPDLATKAWNDGKIHYALTTVDWFGIACVVLLAIVFFLIWNHYYP